MTTPTHSSFPSVLPDFCARCQLDPCSCDYIRSLRPDGPNEHLRHIAAECMTLPLPHREACPCPPCYSSRMATWIPDLASRPGRCRHGYAIEQTVHICDPEGATS